MNKVIPLLAFSILLLVPVGTQSVFGSLIGDEVTVDSTFVAPQTGIVINDLVNPEFSFTIGSTIIPVNIESEEIWIEYSPPPRDTSIGIAPHDWWITDLDWIENGVEVPGIIQDVACTSVGSGQIQFGPVTFTNSEIHILDTSVALAPFETVSIHCDIDVIHEDDQVIGGEIIPLDTTALLLSGTQSFSWMIPVLLSGIGIGLFVFRKSEIL